MMKKRSVLVPVLVCALVLGAILVLLELKREPQESATALSKQQEVPALPAKSKENPPADALPPPAKAVMNSTSDRPDSVSESAPESFRKLTQETLKTLVQQEELRKLSSEELHTFPQILLKSAVSLGEIAEKTSQDPSLVPEAIEFYSSCAGSREIAQSIRALCLARYRHHSVTTKGDHQALPAGDIPESVIQLSQHVKL